MKKRTMLVLAVACLSAGATVRVVQENIFTTVPQYTIVDTTAATTTTAALTTTSTITETTTTTTNPTTTTTAPPVSTTTSAPVTTTTSTPATTRETNTTLAVTTAITTQTQAPATPTEPSAAVPLYDIPLSVELQEYTYSLCEQYGIAEHYEVILGMIRTESNFNANAISSTGDYGLMQINVCNHNWLKQELGIVDIMDAKENIECGVYLISGLVDDYTYINQALMAYNMGPAGAASLWREGIYSSSYSRKVLDSAELIKSSKI